MVYFEISLMEMLNFESLVMTCGYVVLACVVIRMVKFLLRVFYVHMLAKRWGCTTDLRTLGKWAVVTGSTDGIGRGYANELAKRGLNIFLISRNKERLEAITADIKEQNKYVEVRSLVFDFTQSSLKSYDVVKTTLSGLEIGILVNNVGICNEYRDYFHSYFDAEQCWKNIVDVNCFATAEMTYIVLPQMLKRKKGAIINLSSACGFRMIPLMTMYSASKCVHPYYVVTKMSKVKRSTFFAPSPADFSQSALNTIGLEDETVGCLSHAIHHECCEMVPTGIYTWFNKRRSIKSRTKFLCNTNLISDKNYEIV